MRGKVIFTSIATIIVFGVQYLYSMFIANNFDSELLKIFVNVLLVVAAVYLVYFGYSKIFSQKDGRN